ncbi:hypothetical protein SAMN05216326_11287 [Nitrosomonas marina]|uniref:PEP-CTERM protein-sorting domain-containing protein n=1 Tax=Nitrosomonas marina TaxID=917 RepID=A0A1I0BZ45_9PROT|nr:hypothetical protein [Nitrosomonas marina]SET12477.1 hypothetical protein SAMN05216326_11287 [Nitrosomonas marina]
MKNQLLCFLVLMFSGTIHAAIIDGFNGPYHVANWSTTNGLTGELSVDNPTAQSINFEIANPSYTYPVNTFLELQTVAAGTGMVSFDLIMSLLFRPFGAYAPTLTFFTVVDGIHSVEATHNLDNSLFQHVDIMVHNGQRFGFRFDAQNVQQGVFTGATITNFSAPVSEPATLLMAATGVMIMLRLNRSKKGKLRPR